MTVLLHLTERETLAVQTVLRIMRAYPNIQTTLEQPVEPVYFGYTSQFPEAYRDVGASFTVSGSVWLA